MGFDVAKFERAELVPRTKEVAVPTMGEFFGEDDERLWTVRGLDSNELHTCLSADDTKKALQKIVATLEQVSNQATGPAHALALDKSTPGEIAKRLEMLVLGSVEPEISMPIAVKVAKTFPVDFLALTNEISTLTGMGYEYSKPKAALQQTGS